MHAKGFTAQTRQLPVGSQRSLRGPSENGDGPSTTPVSKVPHLPGIEKELVSSSANQSFRNDQPHAPEPVGPDAPLIVPQILTRQRSSLLVDILVVSVRSLAFLSGRFIN